MSKKRFICAVITAFVLFEVPAVHAHTFFSDDASRLAGLFHPLTGIDLVLALLALGLWAAQQGGNRLWQLPVVFSGAMALGVMLGRHGLALLPNVETAVAGSLLLLGLMLALAARLPTFTTLLMVSFFALFHGYAHVSGMPESIANIQYLFGLLLTTSVLQCIGMMLGLWVRFVRYEQVLRISGFTIGITGGGLCL